jgi:hypothetical protein
MMEFNRLSPLSKIRGKSYVELIVYFEGVGDDTTSQTCILEI